MDSTLRVGQVLAVMRGIAGQTLLSLIAFMVTLTVLGSFVEIELTTSASRLLASTALDLVAYYALLRGVLLRSGLVGEGEIAGIVRYFGLELVMLVALLVGFVLLIVPGIVIAIWWTPAVPLLLCERRGISETLEESIRKTRGNFWSLFGVKLLGTIPYFAVSIWILMQASNVAIGVTTVRVVMKAATVWSLTYTALVAVASYKLLFRAHQDVAEVFA